ncbi:MAG TPA: hypothetical protein VGG33_16235 [Polyangia bacterium]
MIGSASRLLACLALVVWAGACVDLARPPGLSQEGRGGAGGGSGGAGGARDTGAPEASQPDAEGDGQSGGPDGQRDDDGGGTLDAPIEVVMLPGLGESCTNGAQCASGHCVEGVCCDAACTELCRSCVVTGFPGICRPVVAGADPRNECPDDGAPTCGRTGQCDGAGACERYAAGTTCAPSVCSANGQVSGGRCMAGSCQQTLLRNCFPYACTFSMSCQTFCPNNFLCAAGATCSNGVCR